MRVACLQPIVTLRHPLALLVPALLTIFSFHFIFSSTLREGKSAEEGFESASSVEQRPLTNVFFLKAHKCASSTVQNILMRFGLEQGLDFVLPATHNYIGNPAKFRADMISENYVTVDGKYNIFAHHSRYDREQVSEVMHDDTRYVTILRHPADVYESIFAYYKFQKVFNITFQHMLQNRGSEKAINRRYFNRLGFNQMSFDLGLPEEEFNSSSSVREFIGRIDGEFDLVMMSEWMEVSLVLFARLMNWPLEHVRFLKLNSRTADAIYVMSQVERQRVIELNSVDYKLYLYFLRRFKNRIKDYGEERMKNDVSKLMALNIDLRFRCVEGTNLKGYGHTQAYKLRDNSDSLCFRATQNELPLTDHLRSVQRQRIKILHKLEHLLNDKTDPMFDQ